MFPFLAPAFLLLTAPLARAEVSCPADTTTIHTCRSTPKAGDQEFASRLFVGMLVCRGAENKYYLFGDTEASSSEPLPARAEMRPGGSTFSWATDDKVLEVRFEVATGLGPNQPAPARLTVLWHKGEVKSSSTYTCP